MEISSEQLEMTPPTHTHNPKIKTTASEKMTVKNAHVPPVNITVLSIAVTLLYKVTNITVFMKIGV